ncbi:MoxR-like ATPase [Actinoplanes lutulentus]|uniref:Dynein-related subfamily AAA family protein n=1 Tax=Actinoplanes lutulentus TaxID=1287878 RepID=A0A327Z075_9ACTN|nr:MoxR family ATPase [Actinoplanes lutulentus]MBB2947619.1 MoxR-like ATPase [Actinoplanes lutulentus]RAK27676.1 dynein-related subfamily AAA family protein [Actinoplanes lutulentus]
MQTRHRVDTSLWFTPEEPLPPSKSIEDAGSLTEEGDQKRTVEAEPYRFSPNLLSAVNLAISLGRPLLVQGDPGVGKTRLAHAVAYGLGLPLEQAHIKSTSRGQDLLYQYDAVRRLHDGQLRGWRKGDDVRAYIRLGPLGRVIARAQRGRRSVLLIDEIDKADLDFPNDLLHELDELAFAVEEVPGWGYAVPRDRPDLRPIIVVTNNEEKALPGAFLRRCVFHYIEFPAERADLDAILRMHEVTRPDLRDAVIDVIERLRQVDFAKRPGLSELLDWAGFLEAVGTPAEQVAGLPYLDALLKQRGDQIRANERLGRP